MPLTNKFLVVWLVKYLIRVKFNLQSFEVVLAFSVKKNSQ